MMSDLYVDIPESTGFEGTASDHLKDEMQKFHIQLSQMLGNRLKDINFYIMTSAYSCDDELEGSFDLTVRVYDDPATSSTDIKYAHSAPNLDDAITHVMRHIKSDMTGPEIGSGRFRLPKLITSQNGG